MKKYSSLLTEGFDAGAATCTEEGYTGDTFCVKCEEIVTEGQPIEKLPHTEGELTNAKEPACTEEGYSGDIYCEVCGELLEKGEAIPATGHVETELTDVYEATCTMEGYSGDERCKTCGAILTMGEVIPMLEHAPGEAVDAREPTCSMEGYTGDVYCAVCEWRVPGLYVENELALTWDQLVGSGYITTEVNELISVADSLMGMLVIDESITVLRGDVGYFVFGDASPFAGMSEIECIYLPSGITSLGDFNDGTFGGCAKLKEIRAFGTLTDIGEANTFLDCAALEEFDIPEGVTAIGDRTFEGCTSLSRVTIPSTVERIGRGAFDETPALTSIELPEGLKSLDTNFYESGVTSLVLPSTLTDMSSTWVSYLDASKCSWEEIGEFGFYSSHFKEIKLPASLKSLDHCALATCTELETLILPDGFSNMDEGALDFLCGSLTTVVWPATLLDGSALSPNNCKNLTTIYYRGSEFQWNLTISRPEFEGVNVIFDYAGDGSELQNWPS